MRKQVALLGVLLLLAGSAIAYKAHYVEVRPNGSSGTSLATFSQIHLAADTLNYDTFMSDTFDVGDAEVVNIGIGLTGFTWADSVTPANQGVYLIVHTITGIEQGQAQQTIYTDTLCADGSALDSTAAFTWHNFKTDTLAYQQLWFRTILVDSFVADSGFSDTSTLRAKYHILWR